MRAISVEVAHTERAWVISASVGALARVVGVASVIDGDTIKIHGQRIRLHGIDTPESRQLCERDGKFYRCGQVAALALSDRIGRRTVSCEGRDTDRYGRVIAVCSQAGADLNGWLVRQGYAVAYRKYSLDYVPQPDTAASAFIQIIKPVGFGQSQYNILAIGVQRLGRTSGI